MQPLFNVLTRLENVDIDLAMSHLSDNQARWKQIIVDFDAAAEKGGATEGGAGTAEAEAVA